MTPGAELGLGYLNTPQWSQPKIGWMTSPSTAASGAHTLPQWSQPEIGWMTPEPDAVVVAEGGAAMEPAEDRLGDEITRQVRLYLAGSPQWSQPKIGWLTQRVRAGHHLAVDAAMEPAEDRLDDRATSK